MTTKEPKTVKGESSQTADKLSEDMFEVASFVIKTGQGILATEIQDWAYKVKALEASCASTTGQTLEGLKAKIQRELQSIRITKKLCETESQKSEAEGATYTLEWVLKILEADSPKTGKGT